MLFMLERRVEAAIGNGATLLFRLQEPSQRHASDAGGEHASGARCRAGALQSTASAAARHRTR